MIKQSAVTSFFSKLISERKDFLNQRLEDIITNLYTHVLESGNTSIDVGAQYGVHTLRMARIVADNGRVFSFEPIKTVFESQVRTIRANSLNNVSAHNLAISDFKGKSEFIILPEDMGVSGLKDMPHQKPFASTRQIVHVHVDTLDNIIPDKLKVRFIKIDTEGADFLVLRGAKRLLLRDRPVIAFECGAYLEAAAKSYNYTTDEFTGFFHQMEYKLYSILGLPYHSDFWHTEIPAYMVGLPRETYDRTLDLLWLSVLEAFLFDNK